MDKLELLKLTAFGAGAFLDGALVPIPIEFFLVSAVLLDPDEAYRYAGASVLGSLLGAPLGRSLARRNRERLSNTAWFVANQKRVQERMQRFGTLGVAICSATPLPFPVVTWSSALIGPRLLPFLFAVAAGRAVKFFVTACVVDEFGLHVLHRAKNGAMMLVAAGVVGFLLMEWRKRRNAGIARKEGAIPDSGNERKERDP